MSFLLLFNTTKYFRVSIFQLWSESRFSINLHLAFEPIKAHCFLKRPHSVLPRCCRGWASGGRSMAWSSAKLKSAELSPPNQATGFATYLMAMQPTSDWGSFSSPPLTGPPTGTRHWRRFSLGLPPRGLVPPPPPAFLVVIQVCVHKITLKHCLLAVKLRIAVAAVRVRHEGSWAWGPLAPPALRRAPARVPS